MRVPLRKPVVAVPKRSAFRRVLRVALGVLLLLVAGGGVGFLVAVLTTPENAKRGADIKTYARTFAQWFEVTPSAPVTPLGIDIKFKNLQILRDRRASWVEAGVRLSGENDPTTARVRLDGTSTDVAISLAGGPEDKAPGDLGRVRLNVKGDGTLFGMRRVVLDSPSRPGLQHEAYYFASLERAGVLAPRMRAVDLEINGKSWGYAVLVEQPGVEGMLAHGRPDGVMVGWDPTLPAGANADAAALLDPRTIDPQVEGGAKRLVGTPLAAQAGLAISMLRDLVSGRVAPEVVLDIPRTARFVALSELWGLESALHWQGPRWVLHPLTLKLEPYARLSATTGGPAGEGRLFVQKLMESKVFRAEYQRALQEEAEKLRSADHMNRLRQDVAALVPVLSASALPESPPPVSRVARQAIDARSVQVVRPPEVAAVPNPLLVKVAPQQALPFALVDAARGTVQVPAGTWEVPGHVLLPQGWSFTAQAGARLRFAAGAWLIVRGPCQLAGTPEAPVVFEGREVEGKPQTWGGIALLDGGSYRWTHVWVRNATGSPVGVWQPQAAVVWVGGDAQVSNLTLEAVGGTLASLRAMGGTVRIQDTTVQGQNGGSGLNLASLEGTVDRLRVDRVGGDGIDVVGGQVQVTDLQVQDAGGAAVRAGAGGRVQVNRVVAQRVGNGLVARDGARLLAMVGQLDTVRHVGFLAYQQAPGKPAQIEARDVTVQTAGQDHLCTGGARVSVQGRAQTCSPVSVQQLVSAGIARP